MIQIQCDPFILLITCQQLILNSESTILFNYFFLFSKRAVNWHYWWWHNFFCLLWSQSKNSTLKKKINKTKSWKKVGKFRFVKIELWNYETTKLRFLFLKLSLFIYFYVLSILVVSWLFVFGCFRLCYLIRGIQTTKISWSTNIFF